MSLFPRGDGFLSNFFGDDFFGGGRRGRRASNRPDESVALAMQRPLGGGLDMFDNAFGGGLLAPMDIGTNLFRGIDDMMADLHRQQPQFGGPDDALATMGAGGGDGTFHSQVMVMSQTVGPDGQVKTKKYAHTDVGDARQGIREVRQAYADDAEQRALHFQQMNERSHWRQSCKDLQSGQVDTKDDVRGFDRSELDRFKQDWSSTALPRVQTVQQSYRPALGFGGGRPAAITSAALPSSARGNGSSLRPPFTLGASTAGVERHSSVQRNPYVAGAPTPYVCEEPMGSSRPAVTATVYSRPTLSTTSNVGNVGATSNSSSRMPFHARPQTSTGTAPNSRAPQPPLQPPVQRPPRAG